MKKLTKKEIYAALGVACQKIEAAGASVALTEIVTIVGNIRSAIGNEFNSPSLWAIDETRKVLKGQK